MTIPPPSPPEVAVPRRRWGPGMRWLAPVALGLLGSVAGLLLFTSLRSEPTPLTKADVQSAVGTAITKAAEAPPHSTAVFTTIISSLVLIQTQGNAERADSSGIGSGVIVRDDGMILTAHHVVDGARTITVTFSDGTKSNVFGAFERLLEAVKADPATAHIPVLVLSSEDDKGHTRQLGAEDHVTKPPDRDRLLRRLRDALTREVV